MRFGVAFVLVATAALAFAPNSIAAQTQASSPTVEELQTTIDALSKEIARLQGNYQLLVTQCSSRPDPRIATDALDREAEARAINRVEQRLQQERLENASWYVKDAHYDITETNKVFFRFSWKVTVKNGTSLAQTFDLEVQFLDASGLVVDTDRKRAQTILAQDEQVITGSELIGLPNAYIVSSIKAIATRHLEKR